MNGQLISDDRVDTKSGQIGEIRRNLGLFKLIFLRQPIWSILKSHTFFPFRANLTQFRANWDIPQWVTCFALIPPVCRGRQPQLPGQPAVRQPGEDPRRPRQHHQDRVRQSQQLRQGRRGRLRGHGCHQVSARSLRGHSCHQVSARSLRGHCCHQVSARSLFCSIYKY